MHFLYAKSGPEFQWVPELRVGHGPELQSELQSELSPPLTSDEL